MTGPWRSLWVRLGFDPRKSREAKKYQMLDFRIRCSTKHGKNLRKDHYSSRLIKLWHDMISIFKFIQHNLNPYVYSEHQHFSITLSSADKSVILCTVSFFWFWKKFKTRLLTLTGASSFFQPLGYSFSDMPVKAKRSALNYSLPITFNKAGALVNLFRRTVRQLNGMQPSFIFMIFTRMFFFLLHHAKLSSVEKRPIDV